MEQICLPVLIDITTLIWMSHKLLCWRAGFSAVPAVFLVENVFDSFCDKAASRRYHINNVAVRLVERQNVHSTSDHWVPGSKPGVFKSGALSSRCPSPGPSPIRPQLLRSDVYSNHINHAMPAMGTVAQLTMHTTGHRSCNMSKACLTYALYISNKMNAALGFYVHTCWHVYMVQLY